jgi:capsular polysaccharide export protein
METMNKPISAFSGKHVLLLQGPLGPFFRRLSRDLTQIGARVSKVNFNGGDWLFYPTGAVQFRGRMAEWPSFLAKLFAEQEIDVVMMYGDCRPVHRDVRRLAEQAGVEMGVFEAGYIRPNYITLERSGINDYSSLPRSADFYAKLSTKKSTPPRHVGSIFWHAALWAILYYIASSILRPLFPHYLHHRRLAAREAFPWIRGLWRKYYYFIKERKVRQKLETDYSGRFFLVPLQVHYDSQMRVHSDYDSVEAFIRHVVSDFGKNAASDMYLVLKHHPMDRAYRDYTRVCETFAEMYNVRGRLLYVHDLDLPTVYKHTRGVVVVNSTVGLSALFHGLPVKVCGRSIYNIPGLTYTGFLSRFWEQATSAKPNQEAVRGFRHFLIEHTQMNGSVYRRLSDAGSHAGIVWNDAVSLLRVLAAKELDTPLLKVEPNSVSMPHRRSRR